MISTIKTWVDALNNQKKKLIDCQKKMDRVYNSYKLRKDKVLSREIYKKFKGVNYRRTLNRNRQVVPRMAKYKKLYDEEMKFFYIIQKANSSMSGWFFDAIQNNPGDKSEPYTALCKMVYEKDYFGSNKAVSINLDFIL